MDIFRNRNKGRRIHLFHNQFKIIEFCASDNRNQNRLTLVVIGPFRIMNDVKETRQIWYRQVIAHEIIEK